MTGYDTFSILIEYEGKQQACI
nr:RNA chaperone Hfq [Bacillus thuringiensis]